MLLWLILVSTGAVLLESVHELHHRYHAELLIIEWACTSLFTVEYCLRLAVARRPLRYARSLFGVVDVCSIVPSLAYLLLPHTVYPEGRRGLRVVRVLRLLRAFRVLKLAGYERDAAELRMALWRVRRKVVLFLASVAATTTVLGTVMYIVEDSAAGFTSIPRSVYWAIVTLTTVGYGDISPRTPIGQLIASFMMLLGFATIAVPTGLVVASAAHGPTAAPPGRTCPGCDALAHDEDASFCKYCGAGLPLLQDANAHVATPLVPHRASRAPETC